jgi:hypothetical protein
MTAESVRDIGYISRKDPFAWMESMKGKHWNNLLLHEKHNYNTLAKQVHKETRHMEKEITDVYQYIELPPFTIGNGSVKLYYTYSGNKKMSFTNGEQAA